MKEKEEQNEKKKREKKRGKEGGGVKGEGEDRIKRKAVVSYDASFCS